MNGGATKPTFQACDTDATVPVNAGGSTDRLFLDIENADDAAVTLTIPAGTGVQAHQAKALTLTLAASGSPTDKRFWGPFESQMICKADGTFDLTIDAATGAPALNIRAIRLPKM